MVQETLFIDMISYIGYLIKSGIIILVVHIHLTEEDITKLILKLK